MRVEKGDQRRGIAGVDRDGMAVVVPHPDVVVFERGQGNERQHDGTVETGGMAMLSKLNTEWFETPLGQHLLFREQRYFDNAVSDVFGFNAVQVGLAAASISCATAAFRCA